MWQDPNNPYYLVHAQQNAPLQFYAAGSDQGQFYPGSRSSLEGNMGTSTSIPAGGVAQTYGGTIQQPGGWWTAFGTGGFEGEPPLLEGERPIQPSGSLFKPSPQNWASTFRIYEPNP